MLLVLYKCLATSSSLSSSGCLVQSFQNHSPPSKGTKSPGSQANPPLPIPARYCLLCPVHCLQPRLTALQAGRSSRAAQHRPAAPSPAGQPAAARAAPHRQPRGASTPTAPGAYGPGAPLGFGVLPQSQLPAWQASCWVSLTGQSWRFARADGCSTQNSSKFPAP